MDTETIISSFIFLVFAYFFIEIYSRNFPLEKTMTHRVGSQKITTSVLKKCHQRTFLPILILTTVESKNCFLHVSLQKGHERFLFKKPVYKELSTGAFAN